MKRQGMSVYDNIIALMVILAPPFLCVGLGHLTGFAAFYFLTFPAIFVGPWLMGRFAPKPKPKTPPAKGWFVDNP